MKRLRKVYDDHRPAVLTGFLAIMFDLIGSFLFAVVEHISIWTAFYWGIATATTVGYGDVTPHTHLGHLVAVAVMLTAIPLFASAFSLLTSTLTKRHVHAAEGRIKKHVEDRLNHHLGEGHE